MQCKAPDMNAISTMNAPSAPTADASEDPHSIHGKPLEQSTQKLAASLLEGQRQPLFSNV